jgi:hypothetical protein
MVQKQPKLGNVLQTHMRFRKNTSPLVAQILGDCHYGSPDTYARVRFYEDTGLHVDATAQQETAFLPASSAFNNF